MIGNIFYYYASIFFLLSCGLIWIPIIGWVLIPVALVCGLVSLIIGIFYNKYRVKCVECDNGFSVPKEKYLSLRTFNDKQKRISFENQKGICPKCSKIFIIEQMEGDHIISWSKGGKTTQDNCQMLCKKCNGQKSNN